MKRATVQARLFASPRRWSLTGLDRPRVHTQVNAMQRFLSRYPAIMERQPELVRSVTDYYHYNLRAGSIGASATAAHLLDDLPLALRCEAVQCLTRDALSQVPLFAQVNDLPRAPMSFDHLPSAPRRPGGRCWLLAECVS